VLAQAQGKERPVEHPTFYRTTQIDGLSIFYREAGPKDAPTLLLLHGLPSSSRMFEPLFARLSDRYHLVAPDYPGFGHSDWPDPKKFAYTFDHYAEIMCCRLYETYVQSTLVALDQNHWVFRWFEESLHLLEKRKKRSIGLPLKQGSILSSFEGRLYLLIHPNKEQNYGDRAERSATDS